MIHLRSFRLRISLLSAALAGSALVGFGIISWFQIHDAKVKRLDAELEAQLIRAVRPRGQTRWQTYEASLPRNLGASINTPIALLVLDEDGNLRYQSNTVATDPDVQDLLIATLQATPPLSPPLEFHTSPPDSRPFPSNPDHTDPPFRTSEAPRLPSLQFTTGHTETANWRIGSIHLPNGQVAIAVSLQAIHQEMAVIRNLFLISIPGLFLLIAGGAWVVSGSALRPIQQLTAAIQRVTAKGLDQRIPQGTTDEEFVQLIQVFNQMLERLERSFKQASRFSADAAHELKTPLAILQGELERTLQQASPGSEMQQTLAHLQDEVRRLSGIVRKLLLLSLADAGQISLYRVEVNLSDVLMEMVEDIEVLAPHLIVQTNLQPGVRVQGDRDLLTQVLQNLLSNAIKYNLPNGWIQIHARQTETTALVTITNASKDIPLSDRDRIFDRFHRGDPARTRKTEGIGLGLSLAREIAQAHGGSLTLDPTPSGQTAFTLTLPERR